MKKFFALFLFLFATVSLIHGETFHVDCRTTDPIRNGSKEKPFATLDEARHAVRKIQPKKEPVEIIVARGIYDLDRSLKLEKEDSGTEAAPVIWRAATPGKTSIRTSVPIPSDLFQPLSTDPQKDRIDADLRTKIFVVDLKLLGMKTGKEMPNKLQTPLPIPELFFNGDRMKIACWPNDGWATIDKIVDSGSKANSGSASEAKDPSKMKIEPPRGGSFLYSGDRPNRWDPAKGIWLHGYWCFDWSSEVLKVASIDPGQKKITLENQHTYGLRQGNPSPRRWMVVNQLEELDQPGEYYFDPTLARIYFYPPKPIQNAQITVAFRNDPIIHCKDVSYVSFKGFVLEESYSNALSAINCSHLVLEKDVIRNTRAQGVSVSKSKKCTILSCLIEQTGSGGISLDGGDRKTLERADHLVENCVIRSFSKHRLCYANGLVLSGVGSTARHNEFYDAPHQAIALSGNDMIFEYNTVHDVCLTGDDCGALYKGRDPSKRGNIVRYNYWYNIGSPRGHGNAAIYFDDGDGGELVYGNIFVRAGEPGKGSFGVVFSHGGHGNRAINNIFIDCKRPLGSSPWNDKRWKEYIAAPLWQNRLLKDVDITKPPYTDHYPDLIGFMDGKPETERRNTALRNVFVNSTLPISGNWDVDSSNWKVEGDPGFVDMKNGNYSLRKDSEVFKKIPDFEPIPFEKIGPK